MATADAGVQLPQSLAGRRLGRYEVLCQLASGGMASVYVARALGMAGFERLVAVKVLHPHLAHEEEFISMFLDEARLAARIRHPNVVPTLDISDTEGDGFFLVMEYIEGHHLGALLQQAAKESLRVPPPVIVRCVLDALGGLGAAHELVDERGQPLKLVHRDVSPHNVMVGTDGIARLTDFGVAKAEVRLSSTRDGQFKGKLAYMAPEHASQGTTDQRSDLFAMGIILWEGLTGKRLFRADTNAAALNKILVEPIPPPSSVRAELAPFDSVLAKALARAPEDRYQTANEMAEAIEEAAGKAGGVGTQRAVGEVVKKLAAEKLVREKQRILQASDALSLGVPGSAIPLPPGSGSEPSMPSRSQARQAGWSSAQTSPSRSGPLGTTPIPKPAGSYSTQAETLVEGPPRRNPLLVPLVVVCVLLALGGVTWGILHATPTNPAPAHPAPQAAVRVVPVPVPVVPVPQVAVAPTPVAPVPPPPPVVPTPPPTTHGPGHRHHGGSTATPPDDDVISNPYRH